MNATNPYRSPQAERQTNHNQWAKWEKTRARGRKRYLWLNGVVGWGVPVAVLWSLWMGVWEGWNEFPTWLGAALLLFPIAGYFWGVVVWWMMERQYQKAMASDAPQGDVP